MSARRHRLALRRKTVGFTQEGLAGRLGVDPTTVRRWESGETETGPQPWLRPKLAHHLQVSTEKLEELLGEGANDPDTRELLPSRNAEGEHVGPDGDSVHEQPKRRAQQVATAGGGRNLFQLPPDIEDFTGRSADLTELTELLTLQPVGNAVVLAALSGKGGIGKTTLAVHVAHRVREYFPDGQLYVDLRGFEARPADPSEVLGRFLGELGLDAGSIPEQLGDRARLFRAQLAERSVLVVLDNARDEKQVRPLIPGNSHCAVLATSRKRLIGLAGAHHQPLDVMTAEQGLDLLRAILGAFRVDAESDAAKMIVKLCGWLPLAIRIAGARLASRPRESIALFAKRLDGERTRLDLLKAGDLEVRSSFALSLDGCDEELLRAFRLLGILEATDFAAWPLALLLDVPVMHAEDLMERLVDAELLEIAAEDPELGRRYRFHDLLRLFARECLDQAEPISLRKTAVERLVGEYVRLGTNAAALLEPGGMERPVPATPEPLEALQRNPRAWVDAECPAFVAGVKLAFDHEVWDCSWRLAELPVVWRWQFDWSDWAETHRFALDAAQRNSSAEGEARFRCSLGLLYRAQGRYDEAIAQLDKSAAIFAEIGDELRRAIAKRQLGDTYRYTGRLHEGVEAFSESLEVFERAGNPRMIAGVLNGLGDIYRGLSRWEESIDCFTRCIQLYETLGDELEVARAKVRFGIVYRDQCLYDLAEELYRSSLVKLGELSDQRWEARTLRHLGIVYRNRGQDSTAIEHFERCLEIFDQLADHRGVAVVTRNLGDAHRRSGDMDKAEAGLTDALHRFRDLGDQRWEARTLISLADTIRCEASWSEATEHLDAAMTIYRQIEDKPGEARVFRSLGMLHRDQGRWEESIAAFKSSQDLFEFLGDQVWVARAIAGQATTLKASGDHTWQELQRRAEQICEVAGAESPDEIRSWLHEW